MIVAVIRGPGRNHTLRRDLSLPRRFHVSILCDVLSAEGTHILCARAERRRQAVRFETPAGRQGYAGFATFGLGPAGRPCGGVELLVVAVATGSTAGRRWPY